MKKHSMVCAGIDTGKHKLDVALAGRAERLQVANTDDGHRKLTGWLRQQRVKRVGIEASGGYEQAVVSRLRCEGFVVVVFQPMQVRAYARFHLQLAKNDKIDAALIAACTVDAKKIHAPADPRLVPRHRGFDGLGIVLQDGEVLGRNENLDASRNARLAANETRAFEAKNHLVDGGRGYAEVPLYLALSGRAPMHARVGVDEGEVLALLGREAGSAFARHLIHLSIRLGLQSGGSDECTLSHHVDPIRAQRAWCAVERR